MLNDPLLVALVARVGGTVEISGQEIESASGLRVAGTRNPLTGEIRLQIEEE